MIFQRRSDSIKRIIDYAVAFYEAFDMGVRLTDRRAEPVRSGVFQGFALTL